MSVLTFRNKIGDLVDMRPVTATELKNQFSAVFEDAVRAGPVVITKNDKPRAVLISYDEFKEIMDQRGGSLDALSSRFDGLLAKLQTPEAKAGLIAAINASPKELGKAAVKAARRR